MPVAAALMSSARPDWLTPAVVLDRVYAFDAVGLDPCAGGDGSLVKAHALYRYPEQDGLKLPWSGRGLVWCNPPYSRSCMEAWAKKLATEGAAGVEILALLPARTAERWWHRHIIGADAHCFWNGRIRFVGASSGAPFPSVIAYWGERAKRFRAVFGCAGWIP